MTSPAVARQRSRSRDHNLSTMALSCGWLHPFRSTASQDVTGQGLRRGQLASARRLSPRSLAVRASPQPDRLGHLLSPHVTIAGWSCLYRGDRLSVSLSRARLAPTAVAIFASPDPLSRILRERAASRVPPRRGARSAAPEVPSVRWITPAGAHRVPPQAVPNLWSNEAGAFFDPRSAGAFDEALGQHEDSVVSECDQLR
jgi:hypothetical protein